MRDIVTKIRIHRERLDRLRAVARRESVKAERRITWVEIVRGLINDYLARQEAI